MFHLAGTYLYISGTSGIRAGYSARMVSPALLPTSSRGICVRFWFNMAGNNMGTLNGYVLMVSYFLRMKRNAYSSMALFKI